MIPLKIATYNIHKGFSLFNRRVVLPSVREQLRELDADIVFLQEVQGEHQHHAQRHSTYPQAPQHEFLADETWQHHAYGMNAQYAAGHHGNAILSRFPIVYSQNKNVSAHRFEQRGLLHCEMQWQGESVHCICVHLGLFANGRRAQIDALIALVKAQVPANAALIIAGDFNDWNNRLSQTLHDSIGVQDVFHMTHGKAARSFPAALPMLQLDRIYTRGFKATLCEVHPRRRLSDHAALTVQLER